MSTSGEITSQSNRSVENDGDQRFVFVTTHWSVVLMAGQAEEPQALNALEILCQTYWYPLYAYVRRRGHSPDDAQDLTQGFFAWLLERRWFERANQERGRLRSFLLTSMSNFLANEWDKSRAQKRGGGKIVSWQHHDAESRSAWEPSDAFTPEQDFEWRWALTLLNQVMDRLSAEFESAGKRESFEALKPCLLGERDGLPYALLASKLGMSEGSVKVAVHRLRKRYRLLLRQEIANTISRPEEVEEEIRHLFKVLQRR